MSGLAGGVINLILYPTPSIPSWITFWVFVGWIVLMAILLSILYMNDRNQNKLRFGIFGKCRELFKAEPTNSETVDGDWSIRVHSPNRPVKGCEIWLNNKRLPWSNEKGLYTQDIVLGGGWNARIPRNEFPDAILWHAEGEIREGKKTREKFRFAELKDVCKRGYGT